MSQHTRTPSHAFPGCRFCHGRGCLACPGEREKAQERAVEPIFTARLDDPHDIELLRQYFGREAVEKAFSAGGGGIHEVEFNAAVASLLQALHRSMTASDPESADSQEAL